MFFLSLWGRIANPPYPLWDAFVWLGSGRFKKIADLNESKSAIKNCELFFYNWVTVIEQSEQEHEAVFVSKLNCSIQPQPPVQSTLNFFGATFEVLSVLFSEYNTVCSIPLSSLKWKVITCVF